MQKARVVLFGFIAVLAAFTLPFVLGIWLDRVRIDNSDSALSYQGWEGDFAEPERDILQRADRKPSEAEQASQATHAEESTRVVPLEPNLLPQARDSVIVSDKEVGRRLESAPEDRRGLSAEFPLEGRDEEWANAAESAMFEQIAQTTNLSLASLRAECGETICRMQMVFPSQALFREYLDGGNRVDFEPLFELADIQPIVAVDHRLETATANFYFVRRETSSTQSTTVVPSGV